MQGLYEEQGLHLLVTLFAVDESGDTMKKYSYFVIEGMGYDVDRPMTEPWEFSLGDKYVIYDDRSKLVDKNGNPIIIKDTSEMSFWRNVNKFLYGNYFIIKPTWGNRFIRRTMRHICNRSTTKEIVLCPDWYASSGATDALLDIKEEYTKICKNKGITLLVIDYYTFEWSILSSPHILEWAYAPNIRKFTTMQQRVNLHKELLNISDPSQWAKNQEFKSLLKQNNIQSGTNATFEQLSSHILTKLLSSSGFAVGKGELGTCWCGSCHKRYECVVQDKPRPSYIPSGYSCGLIRGNRRSLKKKYTDFEKDSRVLSRIHEDIIRA